MTRGERRRIVRSLDGSVGCVGEARHLTRALLERLEPPIPDHRILDVQLAVSELVANAVRHAPGPIELEVTGDDRWITISVRDRSPELPAERESGASGGFGLPLLHRLADRFEVVEHPDGKTVLVSLSRRGLR